MVEVIVALDVPRAKEALDLLDRLPGAQWVKVGPVLLTREGSAFARELVARKLSVFLDLKWHDIPNTVSGAVAAARELGVAMATVHTLGGREMLEAAATAAGGEVGIVGVTVLTSHDPASYGHAVGQGGPVSLDGEVLRLAETAQQAGLRGVVCSPHEVSAVRQQLGGDAWIVVPGIRRRTDPHADQVRVATAQDAVFNGATHLVVGRPILQAPDPAAAFREFVEEAQWDDR
jgi:orotidine-5'-phosphate decarboxylase